MFLQVGKKEVHLTEEFCKTFSEMPHHAGDRDRETAIGKRHIEWLRGLVDQGKFHDPRWVTCLCKEDGVKYRTDGGHSSLMLSQLNGAFPKHLTATILEFVCDTKADLADLFDMFDSRKSVRTSHDRFKAHRAIEPSLVDIAPTVIKEAVSGVAYYCRVVDGAKGMNDEDIRVRLIHEYPEFICWSDRFTGTRRLRRTGVVAAMFATFQKDPAAADKFWNEVLDESNADSKSPSRILATFCRERSAERSRGSNAVASKWDTRAWYCKSIHAWNAFRRNRRSDLSYFAKSELPKPV